MKHLLTAIVMTIACAGPALAQSASIYGDHNQQTIINQTFVIEGPVVAPPSRPMMRFGQFCMTAAGPAGPGQPMPVGSFCSVPTPYGMLPGRIEAFW